MTFQPVIPGAGIAGSRLLQPPHHTQLTAFNKSPQLDRDAEYFRDKIGEVQSAEDLVKDRRLLGVALGAFGLNDDIDNRYFIQKILQDGTESDDALANRLADKRYQKFSDAFGFGPGGTVATTDTAKMAGIISQNRAQSLEEAVGAQEETLRLAL